MPYNFDEIIPRRGTNSIKWDCPDAVGNLPLWVADMDFRVAKPIQEALLNHVSHGIFGYAFKPEAYYDAVIRWFESRHGWHIKREHILCTAGIIPTLSAIIQAMTTAGGKVAIHVPSYNCFFESPRNAGRTLNLIPLKNNDGHFEVDWQAMEEGLRDASMFIFCNPHNPTGRVWTREEVERVEELCRKHKVFVVADEIHAPLAFPGHDYTPFATVAKGGNYCVCTSSTKAFNTAGLPISNIIIPDDAIRSRIAEAIEINRVGDVGPLAIEALMAAYNGGEEWLDQARAYIRDNYEWMYRFLRERLPAVRPVRMEGTYLCWVDISGTGLTADTLCRRLREEQHVMFNPGDMYGDNRYIRINMACPRAVLQEAMQRFHNFVSAKLG